MVMRTVKAVHDINLLQYFWQRFIALKTRLCTEHPQNRIWEWLYAHRHLVWNRRRLKLEFRRKTPPLVVNWCSRHAALPGCGNFSPLGPNSGWWRTFSNVLLQCRAALLLMWWPGPGEISRHRLLQLLLLSNEQWMWCWFVRNSKDVCDTKLVLFRFKIVQLHRI